MTRSARDPDLQDLASAVRQTRRTKKRPQAAANAGPVVAIVIVALVVGATAAVYWVMRGRTTNTAAASPEPTVTKPVVEPKGSDVTPMRAMTSPRTAAAADEQAVLVTVVSAKVGPIELFPVKKPRPAPAPASSSPPSGQSKLFGKIPEPEERPQMSDPMLAVRVRIQNKSGAAIEYRPWNDAAPALADEAGNVYGFCHFTNAVPEGRVPAPTTLRSGESTEDLLIFQRPPATIRSLELHLPGKNVGAPQSIHISISPSQITGL
jgi:hypothetical protein